ncbi:MAG TPA: hypothetical protein VKC11_13945 [Steroidobacteraceae bacterium]|nr:hypothetical protein [Steroidobacteraceae bacterium]
MHARLEELISLRDRQPVDAATVSHVASCAPCAAEIRRLAALRAELTQLQTLSPPELWPLIEARLGGASGSVPRRRWMQLSAAGSIAALVLALAASLPQLRVADPVPSAGASTQVPLQTLVARSQRLETTLRQLPQRPAVEVAANAVAIDALQSRIQRLDMELASDAAVESDPDRLQELWSQRVSLLNSLFGVRYAEAVHAGYRATLEQGTL